MRPWFRQPRTPAWDKEIYQAALQYERAGSISTRVDLGYIVSPIGLGMMDARPDVNPTIGGHSTYFSPMPVFEPGAPKVQPIASTYPLGGQLTASTTKWDARAALIASPPNRIYVINAPSPNPAARPIIVAGGGITPKTGLRVGLGIATGEYAKGSELTPRSDKGRGFTLVSTEAEYAFGTRSWPAKSPATCWRPQSARKLPTDGFCKARRRCRRAGSWPLDRKGPTLHRFGRASG